MTSRVPPKSDGRVRIMPAQGAIARAVEEVLRRLPPDVVAVFRLGGGLPPVRVLRFGKGQLYRLRLCGDPGRDIVVSDVVEAIGAFPRSEGARNLARALGGVYRRRKERKKRKGRGRRR